MTNIINNITTNYGLPLPAVNNRIVDDIPRLINAITAIDSILALKLDSNPSAQSNMAALNTNGQLKTEQVPGFIGDVTSSAGSTMLVLSDCGVTPGTYNSVTVDSKGRVVNGSTEAIALKTVNGSSLFGIGNIVVTGDDGLSMLDGGTPFSNYGGLPVLDGGHI